MNSATIKDDSQPVKTDGQPIKPKEGGDAGYVKTDSRPVKLQVLIATCGGLDRVAAERLPVVVEVGYLIMCQAPPGDIPRELQREDICVMFNSTTGLSHNRNQSLDHATAPYALLADDDLTFYPEALRRVIDIFESHPSLDIATFRFDSPMHRVYPPGEHDLTRPYPCHHIASVEIAVNLERFNRAGLRFNPLMGIGAPYLTCGEESLLMEVARRKRLSMRFFPLTICSHPDVSTGVRQQSAPGVLRAQGALILLLYPWSAALRLLLKAHRSHGGTLRNLYYLSQGAIYALRHRSQLLP